MLNLEENQKLQNSYLERIIRQKGFYLDNEVWTEMGYWKWVLEREVNENSQLRASLQQISNQRDRLIKQLEDLNQDKEEVKRKGREFLDSSQKKEKILQNNIISLKKKHQEAIDKIQVLETDLGNNDKLLAKKKKNSWIIKRIKQTIPSQLQKEKAIKTNWYSSYGCQAG